MIVYSVKNDKIFAVHRRANDYVLQENEYQSNTWYLKPYFTGTEVIESITQAEIDERNALELEQQNIQDVERQLSKANGIALAIFVFVRKDSVGLTDNQKSVLMGLAALLRNGNIEQAQADFNAITRPANANKMQRVYDRLKEQFDNL